MKGVQPFIASCFTYRGFFDSLSRGQAVAVFLYAMPKCERVRAFPDKVPYSLAAARLTANRLARISCVPDEEGSIRHFLPIPGRNAD